jgi:hypothetical protein
MRHSNYKPPSLGDCDFAALHSEPNTFSDVVSYYNLMRDYVKHEDGLINSRLTWSLTVHGFLLTSFGLFSKSSDLYAEFTRASTVANPLVHGFEIAFLCFAQVLVTVLGWFVARSSLGAIRAAHMAIQYLNCVAHSGAILNITPTNCVLAKDVHAGDTEAFPEFMEHIAKDTYIAVGDLRSAHEIVAVTEDPGTSSFKALFQRDHPKGSEVRPLGWGLLPRVIGGGDRGPDTKPAHTYYFLLPRLAGWLWISLAVISMVLGVSAAVPAFRNNLLSLGKVDRPAIQQRLARPLLW